MAAQSQDVVGLQFYMMGELSIRRSDGGQIESLNRKEQALLCYLKVNGRSCSRRELEAMLWPHSAKSQVSLRVAINHLRQDGVDQFLDISDEAMAFNQQNHWSDVEALQYQIGQVDKNPQADLQALMHIVDQCQNDFLPGLKIASSPMFEEWKSRQQSRVEQLLIHALERLVLLCSERGDDDHAQHYAARLVNMAPWHRNGQQYLAGIKDSQGDFAQNRSDLSAAIMPAKVQVEHLDSNTDKHIRTILQSDMHPLSLANGRLLFSFHWGETVPDDEQDAFALLWKMVAGNPLALLLMGRLLRERPYLTIFMLNQQLATFQSQFVPGESEHGVTIALAVCHKGLKPSVRDVLKKIVASGWPLFTVSELSEFMQKEPFLIQDNLDHLVRLALLQKVDETHYKMPGKLLLLFQTYIYE